MSNSAERGKSSQLKMDDALPLYVRSADPRWHVNMATRMGIAGYDVIAGRGQNGSPCRILDNLWPTLSAPVSGRQDLAKVTAAFPYLMACAPN